VKKSTTSSSSSYTFQQSGKLGTGGTSSPLSDRETWIVKTRFLHAIWEYIESDPGRPLLGGKVDKAKRSARTTKTMGGNKVPDRRPGNLCKSTAVRLTLTRCLFYADTNGSDLLCVAFDFDFKGISKSLYCGGRAQTTKR
jgi:hypothetical protein